MLLRELALVVVLVIVLISFYIRFRAAGKKEYVRTRERRLAQVVSSARKQMIVVLVLLAAVLVYDRVLPHFGIGAQAAQTATSSHCLNAKKPTKKEQSSRLKKAQSVSKQAKSLSQSISKSSSVAAKASAASASKASSSAVASSASAAKAASASSVRQVLPVHKLPVDPESQSCCRSASPYGSKS
jgi:ABC-type Fe3+ transport system permease subunit